MPAIRDRSIQDLLCRRWQNSGFRPDAERDGLERGRLMVDIVDRETRSRMMAGIQGKDTRPEMLIRRGLHAEGFRYRLHGKHLPGRPDLVFPSRHAVVFVNGCFWHGHRCHLFKWPSTRREWWRDKIHGTRRRDRNALRRLREEHWRVLTVWECALKGRQRLPIEQVIQQVARWLNSDQAVHEIRGTDPGPGGTGPVRQATGPVRQATGPVRQARKKK